jgi:hypothetical protein
MTLGKLKEILEKNNIPDNAILMSDSGWECDATDMNGIYYNKEKNIVVFTQGYDEYNPKNHHRFTSDFRKGYEVLYIERDWVEE